MDNIHMDEKWKLSKKGSRNYSRSKREQSSASSCSGASSSCSSGSHLKRSSSMPEAVKAVRRPGSPGSSPRSLTSRCTNLVKEKRAKFYIMRRCAAMLLCWRDYP